MIKTKDYVLRVVSDIPLLICTRVPSNGCWIYELNLVGKLIWEKCEEFDSVDELVENLDYCFEEKLNKQQKDTIADYCKKLRELGVLKDEK